MVLKFLTRSIALLALLESFEIQGIMLVTGAHIINDQIVVSNLVAVFRMIPIPTHILDELPFMVDQHIIYRNHSMRTVPHRWTFLEPFQATLIQLGRIPIRSSQKSIQAGLIGGLGKLPVRIGASTSVGSR